MKKYIFILLLVCLSLLSYSQYPSEKQVISPAEKWIKDIESTDLSFLWAGELSQDNRLGFIGDNFERIRLQFLSVIVNYDNPFEYFVYGKTMVNNVICDFQGSLNITKTGLKNDTIHIDLNRGFISGDFVFFEDPACMHSGVFRGYFVSQIYQDKTGTFYYDDIDNEDDNFTNNEFIGDCFDYKSEGSYICNFGDFRIPESGNLDVGKTEFSPSAQFLKNGWENFSNDQNMENIWWK
jgi:hypothetical protein